MGSNHSLLRVLILGAGGHAQVVADVVLSMAQAGAALTIAGFLDDDARLWGSRIFDAPVLGPTDAEPSCPFDALVVGIGSNTVRRTVVQRWQAQGATFTTLVHPSAIVAQDALLGPGTVLCAGVVVNTGSRIGDHVILNTACSVDHHNLIADYAHVAPGAHLGGDVQVAEGAMIGMGAIVLPQRQVAAWACVGAGAVVTRAVEPHQTVVGVPARPLARLGGPLCWSATELLGDTHATHLSLSSSPLRP